MYKVVKRNDGKYAVIKEGQTRAYRVFDNLKDANELKNKLNGTKNSSDTNKTKSSNENEKKEISKNETMKVENKNNKESSSNNIKKTKKRKSKKKNKALITILVIVFILFVGFMALWYFNPNGIMNSLGEFPLSFSKKDDNDDKNSQNEGIIYDDFQIHFMMLGNDKAGDSIYIKAGDNDILIDAGSTSSSASTIEAYVDKYCTDKKLEYVIATHGDSDHISAFPKIFDYYEVDTVIDFTYSTKTTSTYKNYLTAREKAKNHYTTKECFNNENGAKRKYILGSNSDGDEISFEILYNYYYFTPAKDENNNSVVTMFNYGEHHFFLGGDLEKEGEEKLASYYDSSTSEKTLPEVDLYKAGHHGSKTSSNDCLLSLIKPKMCVVSCCAGTTEYTVNRINTFPTQAFIDRIAKYTDSVYITSMYNEETDSFEAMNGNVIVSSDGKEVGLSASNNLTKLKDTTWFSHEIWVNDKDQIVKENTLGAKKTPCRTLPNEWK